MQIKIFNNFKSKFQLILTWKVGNYLVKKLTRTIKMITITTFKEFNNLLYLLSKQIGLDKLICNRVYLITTILNLNSLL